jgi:hypothetical protein
MRVEGGDSQGSIVYSIAESTLEASLPCVLRASAECQELFLLLLLTQVYNLQSKQLTIFKAKLKLKVPRDKTYGKLTHVCL